MAWKIGKVRKTVVSANLRNKFKKMFATMGMHRDIDRLSKISDLTRFNDELNMVANVKYPRPKEKGRPDEHARERNEFIGQFLESVYKVKFKRANKKMLTDMYESVRRMKKGKNSVTISDENVKRFYSDVCKARNYDEFSDLVYADYMKKNETGKGQGDVFTRNFKLNDDYDDYLEKLNPGKVNEAKFKIDNKSILRDIYKAIDKIRRDRIDKRVLTNYVANFYTEVSRCKDFDTFAQLMYDKHKKELNDLKEELDIVQYNAAQLSGTGATKKIKIEGRAEPCEIPKNYNIFKSLVSKKLKILDVIGKKKYAEGIKKLGLNEGSLEDADGVKELSNVCNQDTLARKLINSLVGKVFEADTKEQVHYIREYLRLNSKITYSTKNNDLIGLIALIFGDYEPSRVENRMSEGIEKMLTEKRNKESKGRANAERQPKAVGNTTRGGANTGRSPGSTRVSELRKKFENQNIMGIKRDK